MPAVYALPENKTTSRGIKASPDSNPDTKKNRTVNTVFERETLR